MNLLKRLFGKKTKINIPILVMTNQEHGVLANYQTHPAKWSTRRMNPETVKLDHHESGVWVLLKELPPTETTSATFNGHRFSDTFAREMDKTAKARLDWAEATAAKAASDMAIKLIDKAFFNIDL